MTKDKRSESRQSTLEKTAIEARIRNLSTEELRQHVVELTSHSHELERQLDAIEKMQRDLVERCESSPVGDVTLTLTGTVVEANRTTAQMLGLSREELLTIPFTRFVVPEFQEAFHRHAQNVLEADGPRSCEIEIELSDNSKRLFRLESAAVRASGGKGRWRAAVIDITDHRQEREAFHARIAQLEENLSAQATEMERRGRKLQAEIARRQRIEAELHVQTEIVGSIADGVCLVRSEDGRVLFTNSQFDDLLGYRRGELLGRPARELYAPDERIQSAQADEIVAALERRNVWRGELRIVRKDGILRWCRTSLAPFEHVQHGTIWIGVLHDITAQRQAQEALREREILDRAILNSLPAHLAVLDATGTIIAVNHAWDEFARKYGGNKLPACFHGINYLQVCRQAEKDLGPDFREVISALQSVLEGKRPSFSYEYECHSPEQQAWFLMHATPLLHEQGGAVISHTPVTERVLAEQARQQSENRLRDIVNTAADAIITYGFDGIVKDVNPAAERMFGWSAADLVGREVATLLPSPYRERHDECLRQYFATHRLHVFQSIRELFAQRRNGSTFPVEVSVSAVEELQTFTTIIRDISERKNLQQQLLTIAENEQRRIGRDLHDEVGQQLTGLGLSATALAEALSQKAIPEEALARKLSDGLTQALRYVRNLSRGLVAAQVDPNDLTAALDELAARCTELHGVACRLESQEPIRVHSGEAATQLFRIAQEAIANAVRHGHAQNVTVKLWTEGELLTLEIRDDGVGIPEVGERGQGAGIQIMESRAGLIGAALEISRPPDGGTVVSCTLPIGDR